MATYTLKMTGPIVLKNMCSNTLKFITIENDFIRYLGIKLLYHLKSKKWLSKVSDFPGQDQGD